MKYYLLGVFASAIMLFGMSYLYGTTSSTKLTEIGASLTDGDLLGLEVVGVVFVIVGFAFKVSAVPFHSWAPDTYEGAPTPVTAFLSVASKAAGFVALMTLIFVAFPNASDVYGPLIWVMAALTMTVGNVLALRQTNIVRMLAYSSVSQGGFILMPLAFAGDADAGGSALNAVVVYLLVYAFMNLGAFAVVIAVSRKTNSGEISSFGGLFSYAPGMAVALTVFMASLAGDPAARRLVRQVQRVQGRARRRNVVGVRARVHRGGQHGHLGGVLLQGVAHGLGRRRSRRQHRTDQPAVADRRSARHHGHRHHRRRRVPAPGRGLRQLAGSHRRPSALTA